MLAVTSITIPIFLLIAIGYLSVRSRLMPAEAISGLGRFVLYFSLPALICHTLANLHFEQVIEPNFVLAYALGSLLMLGGGLVVTLVVLKNDALLASVKSMGMTLPNSAFFGYPVLLQVFHEPAARAFSMALLVENLLLFPVALILLEFNANRHLGYSAGKMLLGLGGRMLRNPLIIAIAAGMLTSALGIILPAALENSMELLGRASAAVALFVIGGSLVGCPLRGNLVGMSTVMLGKLVIHPLLVALVVWLLPPFGTDLQLAVILIAAMPMMSIYPIIGHQYGLRSFTASTLLLTTGTAFVTISVTIVLLGKSAGGL